MGVGSIRQEDLVAPSVDDLRNAVDMEVIGAAGLHLAVGPLAGAAVPYWEPVVRESHARAARPNVFIKIPGTPRGLPAIEETIFAGVPVNVTLLFSREQYLWAAEAYLRGIERRIAAGLGPDVASVASLFISRWAAAVAAEVPERLRNQFGIGGFAPRARQWRARRSGIAANAP